MKTVLVTFVDNFRVDIDREDASLLILLDLSEESDNIDHDGTICQGQW